MVGRVVIVVGHCSGRKGSFGIRFERSRPKEWTATWAFPLDDAIAKREGYDRTKIVGAFLFDAAFPGCPHCSAKSFWVCGNGGHVACWDGESSIVTCPTCGAKGKLSGDVQQLDAGEDG